MVRVRSPKERRTYILEILERVGDVKVSDLAERLNVSEMTIRRDLDFLQEKDVLTRTRGGGVLEAVDAVEAPLVVRLRRKIEAKTAIGLAAARFIREGSTIILDSGSTTIHIAEQLDDFSNLTVVTNDLNIACDLVAKPGIQVVSTGGVVRSVTHSSVGFITERTLKDLQVDQVFLGAGGADIEGGITNESILEVPVKQAMINAARQAILVVDSSKIGHRALAHICPLSFVHVVITDSGIKDSDRALIEALGVDVVVADLEVQSTETKPAHAKEDTRSSLGQLLRDSTR